MPEFECPRCHKRSLPEQETGYYDTGLCTVCEEEVNEELERSVDYDEEDEE